MTRRSFLSFAFTLLLVAAGLIAAPGRAAAQCTYLVDIAGIPPHCFPLIVTTEWGPGITITSAHNVNGVFIINMVPPVPPPCPPCPPFNWVTIDGINLIGPNQTRVVVIGNCCYVVQTIIPGPAPHCGLIIIRPCPPPVEAE